MKRQISEQYSTFNCSIDLSINYFLENNDNYYVELISLCQQSIGDEENHITAIVVYRLED